MKPTIFIVIAVGMLGLLTEAPIRAAMYYATLLDPVGFNGSIARRNSEDSQIGTGDLTSVTGHALLWHGTAASVVDLNPATFEHSGAADVDGNNQVGFAYNGLAIENLAHAYLWSGTADSGVDLHPSQFTASYASGISGTTQVGEGLDSSVPTSHALLWHGTADSVVDLHPADYKYSSASSVSGDSEVGSGLSNDNKYHALLWHGTAASVVELNAAGFESTQAYDVSGNSQVGYGTGPSDVHALLWHGTSESAVDLNPAGMDYSYANGVFGNLQVGEGGGRNPGDEAHALLWSSTADSVIDLHPYLAGIGKSFIGSSAQGIAANGDIVGYAYDGVRTYAVLWRVVPEPSALALVGSSLLIAVYFVRRARTRA